MWTQQLLEMSINIYLEKTQLKQLYQVKFMHIMFQEDDSFSTLKQEIIDRYGKNEITTNEFVSLIDAVKDAEEEGILTVREVCISYVF